LTFVGLTVIIIILDPDPFLVVLIVKLPVLYPIDIIVPAIVASLKRQRTRCRHGYAKLSTSDSERIVVVGIVKLVTLIIIVVEIDIESLPSDIGIV
jgi:hypothetical protein